MTFSSDLLEQARELYGKEPKRPKQASVRRSISASYYALFHRLTVDGAARMMRARDRDIHRELVRRAYQHGNMKERAKEINRQTPTWLQTAPPVTATAIRSVAGAFVVLQEERHAAEYALGTPITRARARDAHALALGAMRDWEFVRSSAEGDYFLLVLLFGKPRS